MPDRAVVFDGIWKKFRRGERHDSLRDLIPAMLRRTVRGSNNDLGDREFWALRDVSFEVRPGQALGIIGPNGAGKSTALKVLTKILRPTKGSCEVHGRVGALIEVAAGFHPDLTGRENVYLQGAIMGMRQAEIDRRLEEIVEFSGIRAFIDTPVKRYSSGMNARLGFSIAAHIDPDVLLIDEILAVGDAPFQSKCLSHILELKRSGRALVFVSHNLVAVELISDAVCVLRPGQAPLIDAPRQAISTYLRQSAPAATTAGGGFVRSGTGAAQITSVGLFDAAGQPQTVFESGDEMVIQIELTCGAAPLDAVVAGFSIHDSLGMILYGENSTHSGLHFRLTPHQRIVWNARVASLALPDGDYRLSVSTHAAGTSEFYDRHEVAYPFQVQFQQLPNRKGSAGLRTKWAVEPVGTAEGSLPVAAGAVRQR